MVTMLQRTLNRQDALHSTAPLKRWRLLPIRYGTRQRHVVTVLVRHDDVGGPLPRPPHFGMQRFACVADTETDFP